MTSVVEPRCGGGDQRMICGLGQKRRSRTLQGNIRDSLLYNGHACTLARQLRTDCRIGQSRSRVRLMKRRLFLESHRVEAEPRSIQACAELDQAAEGPPAYERFACLHFLVSRACLPKLASPRDNYRRDHRCQAMALGDSERR